MHKTAEKINTIRKKKKDDNFPKIVVGMNSCGIAAGARQAYNVLEKEIAGRDLKVELKKSGCLGACYAEPLVEVVTEGMPGVVYRDVDSKVALKIIEEHLLKKNLIKENIYSLSDDASDEPREKKFIFIKNTSRKDSENIKEYIELFEKEINSRKIADRAQAVSPEVTGIYNRGVTVQIWPDNIVYANIKKKDIPKIIEKTVIGGSEIKELLLEKKERFPQIVLRNCGKIDPENIEDYIGNDGYSGLQNMLSGHDPDWVIDELKTSGLRGRGGGGFPTWRKWQFTRSTQSDRKYIVCNGDEGDPGAYMDRSVLEGDPHSVIEGMIIAGFTVGAGKGFVYIRAEYPLAIKRINLAIDQARECGLLGKKVLGTDFSFDIEVRLGAGAFVCGEETALFASIEGRRGTPRPRPPYPSVKGLWDKPTIINNVETFANIPEIILKGGKWFASFGTQDSRGTKVFALTGKVLNSGLIEVPMGTTLKEIVFDIGGGIGGGKKIKAVQTGGPSGGVIPADLIDTPVDYESLNRLGSIMGSGGMIVMDEDDCMVDVAKFYLRFCVDESCGKCVPCRIGGFQLLEILSRISKGEGKTEDIRKMEKLSNTLSKASLCGLGQTAANPVKSTLNYFKEEYLMHIEKKGCPAGKCADLMVYTIDAELCRNCGLCIKNCPANAIVGNREEGYKIIAEKCTKCGECYDICKFGAVIKK